VYGVTRKKIQNRLTPYSKSAEVGRKPNAFDIPLGLDDLRSRI